MFSFETKRLRMIPFTLDLVVTVLDDKDKLEHALGVKVPEDWPGPDFAEILQMVAADLTNHPEKNGWMGLIVHKQDQRIIGDMGFHQPPDAEGKVEIGYSIIPSYRQQGFTFEMAEALVHRAFQHPDIKRITAENVLADNTPSIRILQKLGMKQVGADDGVVHFAVEKTM